MSGAPPTRKRASRCHTVSNSNFFNEKIAQGKSVAAVRTQRLERISISRTMSRCLVTEMPPSGRRTPQTTVLLFALVTCLNMAASAAEQTMSPLRYKMAEEAPPNTVLGDALADSGLIYDGTDIKEIKLSILKGPNSKYFAILPGTHTLRTSDVLLDRDVICPKQETCVVRLDVAIAEPIRLFEIIRIEIEIDDVNDNVPAFPNPRQTVSMSEGMRPGGAALLPLAVDNDSGTSGQVAYSLRPAQQLFALDHVTGQFGAEQLRLVLSGDLDREIQTQYEMTVMAADGGDPSLSGTLSLTVVVTDVNDNWPTFDRSVYNVTVAEDFPLSEPIAVVHASDPDAGDNGAVVYELVQQTGGRAFGVNPESGEIYLTSGLDHELTATYHLTVTASDRGPGSMPATAAVIVNVKDVNDVTPRITVNVLTSSGRAEVTENRPSGEFVAHLAVSDPDLGPNGDVSCTVVDTSRFQIVELYDNEFKILTNDSFDREQDVIQTITVTCADAGSPPLTSSDVIEVSILDVNDNVPKFTQSTYTTSVRENNSFPLPIFYASATDADSGSNGNITYRLDSSGERYIKVDPITGLVSSNCRLDREQIQNFTVAIYAVDAGSPPLTGTANIKVIVDDVNDESPRFTQSTYVFGTFENQPIGTEIGHVEAFDRDVGKHAAVVYTLMTSPDDVSATFRVDPETGRISTKRILDREQQDSYTLALVATDMTYPYHTGTCTVSVHVADRNDHAPTIVFPTSGSQISISPHAVAGTLVTQIQAYDDDVGRNAELVFGIGAGDPDHVFAMNPASGELSVQHSLYARTVQLVYDLVLVVQDGGTPSMSASTDLRVILNGTLGAPPENDDVTANGAVGSWSRTGEGQLSMEVTIVIIVGCLSVVLAGCLATLLACLCRRYRRQDSRDDVMKNIDGDEVRREPEDGCSEPTMTPLTSVTLADSLDQGSPGDPEQSCWGPHLDSGHGSWAESECGTISLDHGISGPRGYYVRRPPTYTDLPEQYGPVTSYVTTPRSAGKCPTPSSLPLNKENAMNCSDSRVDNIWKNPEQSRAPRVPPRPPVAPPRGKFFILQGPPTLPDCHSGYSLDNLMKCTGDNVKSQRSDNPQSATRDPDAKTAGSGSRQSSFSSGKSQELKPLTAHTCHVTDNDTSRDADDAGRLMRERRHSPDVNGRNELSPSTKPSRDPDTTEYADSN